MNDQLRYSSRFARIPDLKLSRLPEGHVLPVLVLWPYVHCLGLSPGVT